MPKSSWKSLLAFTTGKHLGAFAFAGVLSFTSGLVSPALAIFLGRIFDNFSDFGAGKMEAGDLRYKVGVYSTYLGFLGLLSWALSGTSFMSWLVYGELQAKVVQEFVFDGLASQRVEWYDTRRSGVSALLTRLNTYVFILTSWESNC